MSGLKDLVKNTGATPPVRASAQVPAATGLKSLVSSGVGTQSPSSVTGLKSLVAPKTAPPVANTVTNTVPADTKEKASKNNGGFFGGLGYLAEKAYLGFLSSVEGIVDYTAGGIAKMVGADEWAEERFANDWTNYNHADEWYDPGEGWQFAGDVAGGIGTSLPGIAAATIGTIAIGATAGGATPLASKLILGGISSTVAGLGAAGNATKEAYRETGKLTGKEFGYGALSGVTEAALEGVSGAIGKGTGRIIDDMAKKAAKDTAATVAKSGAKTFFKQLGEDFAQEALEEGLAEILSPQFQKLTYNPDAKDATWQEVIYAATVGGISGMIMTGSSAAVNTTQNFLSGKKSVESGTYRGVMESGKELAASEREHDTGIDVMRSVKETYEQLAESLMKTNGITSAEALTERIKAGDITFNTKQKMLLGKLKGATTAARFHPHIESCARVILLDVDRVVKRYDAFGMTDANGKALTVTKEEILSGIDETLLEKAKTGTLTKAEAKTLNLSIRKALSENTVLSTLATADAVGGIMMNTGKFTQNAMQDESLINVEDLDNLVKYGTPEQKQAFADSLGIEDLSKTTFNEVRARIAEKRVAANPAQKATAMQAQPAEQKTPATSTNFEKVQAAGDNTRGVTSSEDTRYALTGGENIIDLTRDNDLARIIGDARGAEKYKKIQNYILDTLQNQPIRLSDGKRAIVDKRDALHIANKSGNEKTAQISKIKEILERAKLYAEDRNVEHNKFDYFCYYKATVKYQSETVPLYVNVGRAINDGQYHIYDITKKIRDTANRINGLERPKPNEGYALENDVSTNIIPKNTGKSNTFSENSSEISSDDGTRRALSEKTARNSEKSTEIAENSTSSMTAEEIDAYARENIEEYRQLNEPSKAAVRMTIREARASGLSDADTLTYAKVAARSGLNIIFDAERALGDGSIKGNTIYINPKNSETRTREVILGHEMFHRLFATGGKKAMRLYREAWNLISEERQKEVRNRYFEFYKQKRTDTGVAMQISEEEVAAAGAEEVFKIPDVWEYLLGEEPTLADKVIRFFYGSARKYSGIDGMPAAARKFIRHYKKLFAELSERQQGTNALSLALEGQNIKKTPVTSINSKKMHVTGDGEEDSLSVTDMDVDTDTRFALLTDEDLAEYMATGKTLHTRHKKQRMLENGKKPILTSESEIREFISNAIQGKAGGEVRAFARVPKRLAEAISDVRSTLDLEGNYLEFQADALREAYKVHSSSKMQGDIALAESDFENLHRHIFDFDGVLSVNDYNGKTEVHIYRRAENGYYQIITVSSSERKSLQITKLIGVSKEKFEKKYAKKIERNTGSPRMPEASNPSTKARHTAGALSTDIIPENKKKINPSDKKISKISSDNGTRRALPETAPRPDSDKKVTDGAMAKKVADLTKKTVYSRKSALEVINRIMENEKMSAGTLNDLTDEVWRGLNACNTLRQKQDFARDMAAFIVQKMYAESEAQNPKAKEAQALLMRLRVGIRKITFSETDIAEIKAAGKTLGIEAKQLQSILARWRKWNARKTLPVGSEAQVSKPELYTMQEFVNDVIETVPHMDTLLHGLSPAHALLEINSRYERAKTDAQNEWVNKYDDASETEMFAMIQSVEQALLDAFATSGERSKLTKITERQKASFEKRLEEYRNQITVFRESGNILSRIKSLDMKQFCNKTQYKSQVLKNSVEQLKKIEHRKNLNRSGTRRILRGLNEWYNEENPMLNGKINNYVKIALTGLVSGEGDFSAYELKLLYDVVNYFVHFAKDYNKVFMNDRWVDDREQAQSFINVANANKKQRFSLLRRLFQRYREAFLEPEALCNMMDGYDDGFFSTMLKMFRKATKDKEIAKMRVLTDYTIFLKENPDYLKKAANEMIEYRGVSIPKGDLISLYLTWKRDDSHKGLVYAGFVFINERLESEQEVIVPRLVARSTLKRPLTEKELQRIANAELSKIESLFSATDKRIISILEKVYNVDCKRMKMDTDMHRLGITNVREGFYYPQRRSNIATALYEKESMDQLKNFPFNKSTQEGAAQRLHIESFDVVLNRYVNQMCAYAYITPVEETYHHLYNLDVSGDPNAPISVRTQTNAIWKNGNRYMQDLIADLYGEKRGKGESKIAKKITGAYVKSTLALNLKVLFSQLSSFFSASCILDSKSIIRGFIVDAKDIDTYCPLAELRNTDNVAFKAQGVLDKIDNGADLLMKPIGLVDRFVVCRLFGACQVQIEKNGGAKVGTEENKIAAGELLAEVILKTQQNSFATERSAAMRSDDTMQRLLTMFSSDAMKLVGRFIDSYGRLHTLRAKLRETKDSTRQGELKEQLQHANKDALKSTVAMLFSAVYMAAIAQLFRWAYGKEQEEDEVVMTMTLDAAGNLLGGLPLIRDIYSFFADGYEMENMTYSAVNDVLKTVGGFVDFTIDCAMGKATTQDFASNVKRFTYSVGQLLGLPARNLYNITYGLVKNVSPTTAYKIDNVFYEKNYKTDFYKAIENDDAEMATYLMSLLYNERLDERMSETVHKELYDLSAKGHKVLPKSAPSEITVDGVEYEVTSDQQEAIRRAYSAVQDGIEKLFANASYRKLDDEARAEAVNYVYDLYYDAAIESTLGIDRGNSVLFSKALGADTLALFHLATRGIASDKDKDGKTVSGSKRKKVIAAINRMNISTAEKLLLLCSKGYKIQDGDVKGTTAANAKRYLARYIASLPITKAEKTELAVACGFEVKNGKILAKSLT